MTALISAELLRLRTVRNPRYTALALLVILPVLAALSMSDSAAERADGLRLIVFNVVIVAAVFAAAGRERVAVLGLAPRARSLEAAFFALTGARA